MDFLQRNPGLTKEKFEDMARKAGFRRSVVRSFVERGIVGGTITYEKRKLSIKTKDVRLLMTPESGSELFTDLEDVA